MKRDREQSARLRWIELDHLVVERRHPNTSFVHPGTVPGRLNGAHSGRGSSWRWPGLAPPVRATRCIGQVGGASAPRGGLSLARPLVLRATRPIRVASPGSTSRSHPAPGGRRREVDRWPVRGPEWADRVGGKARHGGRSVVQSVTRQAECQVPHSERRAVGVGLLGWRPAGSGERGAVVVKGRRPLTFSCVGRDPHRSAGGGERVRRIHPYMSGPSSRSSASAATNRSISMVFTAQVATTCCCTASSSASWLRTRGVSNGHASASRSLIQPLLQATHGPPTLALNGRPRQGRTSGSPPPYWKVRENSTTSSVNKRPSQRGSACSLLTGVPPQKMHVRGMSTIVAPPAAVAPGRDPIDFFRPPVSMTGDKRDAEPRRGVLQTSASAHRGSCCAAPVVAR